MKRLLFSKQIAFFFFLFLSFKSYAQLSSTDINVTVDYDKGELNISWPDYTGITVWPFVPRCATFAKDEKISYKIGGNAAVSLFDNTSGTSSNTNSLTLRPPAEFFENTSTLTWEGTYGQNSGCTTPLVPYTFPIAITTKLEDPVSVSAGMDASCDHVPLSWQEPSSVAGSSNLFYQIKERNAGTSGSFNTLTTANASTSYNALTAAGVEKEFLVQTRMQYPGGRIAVSSGVSVNGRRIGLDGDPSGVFVDQVNCNGDLEVNWNWPTSNNPDNFEIYKSTNSNFSGSTTASVSGSDRTWRDNNANSGTQYYYRIRALASCPNKTTPVYSQYTAGESQVGLGVPSATTTSSISTNTTQREVTVTWVDNSAMEEGFKVVRQGPNGQVEFDVAENTTSYTDNTASICENLTYKVKVFNSCRSTGVISSNGQSAYIPADISSVFNATNKVEATDGEFGDRIELKWKTPTRQVDDWNIYRINPLIPDTTFVSSVTGNQRFYADNTANANTLYEYLIEGVTDCAGNTILSNTTKDVGFRLAFGTINGQVTYDGGTAVKDVKITAEAASGVSGKSGNFNGTSEYASGANQEDLRTDSMTIMAFIRPTSLSGKKVIASKKATTGNKGWELYLNNSNLGLTVDGDTITGTSSFVLANNWFSVGATVSGDSLKLYINGKKVNAIASSVLATDTISNFYIGRGASGNYFGGQIDDMRFYNRAISDVEVSQSYDVYINPSTEGLVGYWRFDEGFGNRAYDYSKTNLTPNKNHTTLVGAGFSNLKPSSNQLTSGAYTDDRGSYFIPFVPYLGNGDNYILTPEFGTHTFTPATTTLFIGGNNPNFSNVDFTDNSSFRVTGGVNFSNTTCPVKDVFVKVDGQVVIQNGEPVRTNDSGRYELRVPIGPHVISLEKSGHTFEVGRFPASGNFNFQNNENLNPFSDSTGMVIIGRVAGGGIQEGLPPGMGRGTNNIGRADITFTSTTLNGCLDTTIRTVDSTGEYRVKLPPMQYTIPDFDIPSQRGIQFNNNAILDLSAAPPTQTETDSVFRDSAGVKQLVRIDSVEFNRERNFIYYSTPILDVVDENNARLYGSDSVTVSVKDSDIVVPTSLLNLQYPIFEENDRYEWNINAFEVYANKDGSTDVFDSVPVTDGKIRINNRLAAEAIEEFEIKPIDDFDGVQSYTFSAGQANTATDQVNPAYSFTKTCEVTLITPNATVVWEPNASDPVNQLFRGVIFGGRALGNSFATAGPQVVTMILRDPPGSNSFSSWEQGTTHTTVSTYENGGGVGVQIQKGFNLGTKFSVGLGYQTETKISNSLISSTNIETQITESNEVVESMTKTLTLSTGTDIENVGPNADLFFGRSMNMDFGLSQIITLIDTAQCADVSTECFGNTYAFNGKGFKIGSTKAMFVIPGGYGTEFVFTQQGIEDLIIPRLEALRNQLLSTNPLYSSNLPASDSNYGKSNDDPVFQSNATPDPLTNSLVDSTGLSYVYTGYTSKDTTVTNSLGQSVTMKVNQGVDSVWWYNRQINLWKEALAKNEKAKVEANSPNRNISYIAGPSQTYTTVSTRDETDNTTINFNLSEDLTLKIGAEIGGNGIEVENNLSVNYGHTTSNSTTTSTSTTFSYTIEDEDAGDNFTVDVFEAKDGYGPIFKTRAGETACPYEGEYTTKYYLPGTVINKATVQQEQPAITTTPSELFNVPAEGQAVFTLNLTNNGLQDQIYDLKILENTNPNGAILKVDGINPNRSFPVPANTSITKQLVVEKGPTHIQYDSIGLVFHSQCQFAFGTSNYEDIADTTYISVQFLPSCTDIEIQNPGDQFVVNTSFNDTLPLLIAGYDINYGGLEKIGLQYKPTAQSSWITLAEEWFKDTNDIMTRYPTHTAPFPIPKGQPYITYDFKMGQLIDQSYQLRALSTCKIPGNPDKTVYSNVISGLADRVNPHPFGTPSPADGVLDPNDDISIRFNEVIEAGSLTPSNFQITGVLNGGDVRHDKTVAFDGASNYLEIANGFDFASDDFTVEFWAKRNTLGTKQVLLSQGNDPNNYFEVAFNAADNIEVTVGSATYTSVFNILDDSTWIHYSATLDKANLTLDIMARSSNGILTSTTNNFLANYSGSGKTFMGKSALNDGDFFDGNAHQLRIWNRTLTSSQIASRLNVNLTGREAGLIGYWPMEEGRGSLAEDKARARNAIVNAQWELDPKSNSAFFDGIDDYLILDSAGTLASTFEMDLTIEFWFKTSGGRVMTMLSNGSGGFTPNDDNRNGWSIEIAADNKIHVKNDSTDFVAVSQDFADNNWHHFALVVDRIANATAFIDGVQQNTIQASNFYGFGGTKFALGARFSVNGVVNTIDQHFSGYLDEVRIWNSKRLAENLELEMFNRLQGDEFGLMVYYPFEEYKLELGVPTLSPSFDDGSTAGLHLDSLGGAFASDNQTPAIALQRPIRNVNFSWSVNNDEMVISPNEAPADIENVILNISVKGIKDLNGNSMQSPATWTAFINKNQVLWQDIQRNLSKDFNDTMTFFNRIVNNGGEVKRFTISNIPSWLTVSPSSGTIDPQSTQRIDFTVNPSINIGDYSADLALTTDFGFDEKYLVNLKVRKPAPDFSFNPSNFSKSMSVIGQIRINGIISANEEDLLVAYSNGQIRGKAQLRYMPSLDKYLAFLDIYSNTNSDSIEFKVWNSIEGELHEDVSPEVVFIENSLIGSVLSPQIFDAVNKISKPVALSAGWNWVSFPLQDDEMKSFYSFFKDLNFGSGDQVKTIGTNTFANYTSSTNWTGNLSRDGLNNNNSYLIHISNPDTIDHKGFVIDPDTLPIQTVAGWNRIGFISQRNIQVNSALANYAASSGDIIKSQRSFSVYQSGLGWVGSLTALEPTKGYLLQSAMGDTFVYPRSGLFRMKAEASQLDPDFDMVISESSLHPADYESNTNMILQVNTCDEILEDANWILVAFAGEDLRGLSGKAIGAGTAEKPAYYLTAYGDHGESMNLFLYNKVSKSLLKIDGELDFVKNGIVGQPLDPAIMSLEIAQDCDQFKQDSLVKTEISADRLTYPNPFRNHLAIQVPQKVGPNGMVQMINQHGKIVFEQQVGDREVIYLNGSQLYPFTSGVYQLRFTDKDITITEKVVKIK